MELVKVLENQVQESDSNLYEMRDHMERNLRYYALEPLGNEQKGRSHYVSPDVLDYVESKKALFSRTFLSNRQVVKFKSGGNTPEGEAEAKTAYVNKALNKAGKERLFQTLWHDALLTKRCILLVEWVDDTKEEVITIDQPMPQQMIMARLGQDPTVIDVITDNAAITTNPTVQPDGTIGQSIALSGEITVVKQAGYFEFTACKPENYYRDTLASSVEESMWITYEDEIPRGTAIRAGYDRDQIEGINGDLQWENNNVQFSRESSNSTYTSTRSISRADDQETIPLFKTCTWINMAQFDDEELSELPDETLLYEIHWSDNEILRWADGSLAVRQIDKMPFFEWSELPVSHAANGMCGADVVSHNQKVNSVLKRAVIDNQNIRNNSRFEAVHDLLLNPRDLIDNTTGGVIFSEQIGSVAPLATPELSPVTFNVLQMMKDDSEMRTGLSSLTKGMNTAVLENQNAKDMVERLTNSAGARPTADARSFAQTFLVPLFQFIVDCAKKYDTSQDQTEASGKMIPIIPSQWQGDNDELEVAVALTPDEAETNAQQLMTMHQMLITDPEASQLYGLEQKHALLDDVFDALGISDTSRYMMRPDDPNFQAQQMQLQEAQQMIQQLQQALNDKSVQEAALQAQIDQGWAQINNVIMDKMEDNDREDRELAMESRQGDRKLDIDLMKVKQSN